MTDFETPKQRIWDDARADKRDLFNKDCEALMKKAAQDIWRMGWSLVPKDINDVYGLLDAMANWCHSQWLKAIDEGDAPAEDISPSEGFLLVKRIIQDAVNKKGSVENDCSRVN